MNNKEMTTDKKEMLEEVVSLLETISSDGVITIGEINILQDWIDNNGVAFIGEDYNTFIIPLQKYIEDGQLTEAETNCIKALIEKIKKGINIEISSSL